MSFLFRLVIVAGIVLLFSCEKDREYGSVSEARTKQGKLVQDLKGVLQDAEDGWVMMLKSSLSDVAYTPLVMKFDTSKNTVDMVTVYGLTVPSEAHFTIGEGTANPLLIFSTGSIMTALYRTGVQASDLTDHMFKVLDVKLDTITVQCYRGGGAYATEGGSVYKLFKRPKDWKWADEERYFDLENTERWSGTFLNYGRASDLKLTYLDNEKRTRNVRIMNTPMQESLIKTFRRADPFNSDRSSMGIFEPFYPFWIYFTNGQSYQTAVTLGHNSMSFYPFTVSQNVATSTHVRHFVDYIGVHYLVATATSIEGSALRLEFAAYNQRGDATVRGEYILK
jgi:hypothetical protein